MKLSCAICDKESSDYECPTCKVPFCSSVCLESHGKNDCQTHKNEASSKDTKEVERTYDFPTEDTVPLEKLRLLRDSEDVKNCLNNHHVRDIVTAILKDDDPTRAIGLGMTEPIFVELADACLKIVEPPDDEKSSW